MAIKYFIISLILIQIGKSEANSEREIVFRNDEVFIDTDADMDGNWDIGECKYANEIADFNGFGECLGQDLTPDANPNFGYWSACGAYGTANMVCFMVYTYPVDFIPKKILVKSFLHDARLRVFTSIGDIMQITESSSEWREHNENINPGLLNPDRKIYFYIHNNFAGLGGVGIDQIRISSLIDSPQTTTETDEPTTTDQTTTQESTTSTTAPSTDNPGWGYHLDTINDIDAGEPWTTNCEKYEVQWENFADCLGINRPLSNDNEGYWTACENFGSFADCRITFTYEAGFSPNSVSIKNFISGTGARIVVSTPSNPRVSVISREGAYNWIDDVVELTPADVANGTEIYFDIFNDFSNFYGIIVDQIEVFGSGRLEN